MVPEHIQGVLEAAHAQGHTVFCVAVDDHVAGAIELHATIRPEVRETICRLKRRGLDLYVISGDHERPTQRLAMELGI